MNHFYDAITRRNFFVALSKSGFFLVAIDLTDWLMPNLAFAGETVSVTDIVGRSVTTSLLSATQIINGIPDGQDYINSSIIDEGNHQHEVRIDRAQLASIRESFRNSSRAVSLASQDGFNKSGLKVQGPHNVSFDAVNGRVRGTEIVVPVSKLTGSSPISLDSDSTNNPDQDTGDNSSALELGAMLGSGEKPDLFVEAKNGNFSQTPEYCIEAPGVIVVWRSLEAVSVPNRKIYRARNLDLSSGSIVKVRVGNQQTALRVQRK